MKGKQDKTAAQKKFSAERARGYNESHVDPKAYKKFKTPSFLELASEIDRNGKRDDE